MACALAVLVSHIGALDPNLNLPDTHLQLFHEESIRETGKHGCLELGGDHVLIFLVIADFCAVAALWTPYLEAWTDESSALGIGILRRCQSSLIKRFYRLGLPFVPVYVTQIWLASHRLAEAASHSFPSDDTIKEAYTVGIQALWSPALSGQLWIFEDLFLAPFVALALQLPVLTVLPRSRIL